VPPVDLRKGLASPILLGAGLKAYYGVTNPVLGNYGVPIKHPPAKLPAEKLVMKATRANSTRVLRGTKGPKQKKDIKANIPTPGPAVVAPPGAPGSTSKT